MKKVITSFDAQENDLYTIKNFTPSIELMEKAGKGCFLEIKKNILKNEKILIVCGSGGNGGDGLVVARYLFEDGFDVNVYLVSNNLKPDTQINFDKYKGNLVDNLDYFILNNKVDVIVDAILGVGINKQLKNKYIDIINKINNINCSFKVSIDINSGIDATSGLDLGAHFNSDLTLTIQELKTGLFLNDGKGSHKEIKVIDAGIKSIKKDSLINILEKDDIKKYFQKRNENSNKGSYGRVALIGGSLLTPGALVLSNEAFASLRCGVGYVNLCIPKSLYEIFALRHPECIYTLFNDNEGHMLFDEESLNKILNYSSILVGPGLGKSLDVYKIVCYLLSNFRGNLVLDADALNSLAFYGVDVLKNKVCNSVILTPHIKEFSRLSSIEISEILKNSIEICKDFARKYGVIVNLKNNVSCISDGLTTYLNINGNAGLAKGGSGDILSGITLGLVNKNDEILKRVASAAYILGLSADIAVKSINEYSLIGSDVISEIPKAINYIIR